jgi:hypothetical protein
MGFRSLRVINQDRVAPGTGFGMHPHRDMEIITVMLEGELEHKDSMGHAERLRPGEVQRMSAGRGLMHSEANASRTHQGHLLQIWILPRERGIEPTYEQRAFPARASGNGLTLLVSPDGSEGSMRINQDARLYRGAIRKDDRVSLTLASGRHAWVQVISGRSVVNGTELAPGDGAAISEERSVGVEGREESDVLVFDLA